MKRQKVVFEKNTDNTPGQKVNMEHKNMHPDNPDEEKQIREQQDKFEKLLRKSGRVLLRIRAVFPFEFFPDSVVVDETKVNIIHRIFFWTAEIQSIPIAHIQDVEVDTSLLFATLKILPTGFSVVSMTENWVTVNYLWRRDAIRARRVIAGLLIAYREGIDLTKVATDDFVEKVEHLGKIQ